MRSLVPLRRFRIVDTSMQPALQPGDRVLASAWLRARPGDVVVVRDPEAHRHVLVKRITSLVDGGALVVRGDNPNVSRDSRHFGPVPNALIVGRVFYRYLPAQRRGRL
jgi:nickel-type superoxide dismutase maturation protease